MKRSFIVFLVAIVATSLFAENSPYPNKVIEMLPAPGQYTNTLPKADADDTADSIAMKASNYISNGSLLSLGAWGGYVIVGFDHTIANVSGEYDFYVNGNAFYSSNVKDTSRKGGSCEPGIVEVSYDANHNGLADDAWYELAGSDYNKSTTFHKYSVTYYKPTTALDTMKGNITEYIHWKDNYGNEGYVPKNSFHTQSYWPMWITEDSITFYGSRLADNGVNESSSSTANFVLYASDWGYVDNHPNAQTDLISFNIDWAVDEDGNHINLAGIDFIKVYTAVQQVNGWLGECSTEVSRFVDLHPNEVYTTLPSTSTDAKIFINSTAHNLHISVPVQTSCQLLSITGQYISDFIVHKGNNIISTPNLSSGIYLLKVEGIGTYKIIKK